MYIYNYIYYIYMYICQLLPRGASQLFPGRRSSRSAWIFRARPAPSTRKAERAGSGIPVGPL